MMPPSEAEKNLRAKIDALLRRQNFLTLWEREFLASLAKRRNVTQKQGVIIKRIAAREGIL